MIKITRRPTPESNTFKRFKLHVTDHDSEMERTTLTVLGSYDTSFICTYLEVDDDDLYRSQFLQAFGLDEWRDDAITARTDELFAAVEKHFIPAFELLRSKSTRFTHIMLMMGDRLTNENLFRVLFVFDIFQYAHRCFCDIAMTSSVTDGHMNDLLQAMRG